MQPCKSIIAVIARLCKHQGSNLIRLFNLLHMHYSVKPFKIWWSYTPVSNIVSENFSDFMSIFCFCCCKYALMTLLNSNIQLCSMFNHPAPIHKPLEPLPTTMVTTPLLITVMWERTECQAEYIKGRQAKVSSTSTPTGHPTNNLWLPAHHNCPCWVNTIDHSRVAVSVFKFYDWVTGISWTWICHA
jgi:hypothetical protein